MSSDNPQNRLFREPIPRKQAWGYWLKLGFISFGGPAGQISLMHQELVEKRRWISEQRFLHALNYTMLLPGPEAQQLATYMGWLMHGRWGGLVAGLLFILPAFFILLLLSWVYMAFGDVAWVQGILYGIKPAVTAIVLFAAYRIGKKALTNGALKAIALMAFVAIFFLALPFPLIIISAAVLGYGLYRWRPQWLVDQQVLNSVKAQETISTVAGSTGAGSTEAESIGTESAIINDHSPTPTHARLHWPALAKIALVGLVLWLGLMVLLIVSQGVEGTLTQMAWFFSKAAMLTFGGAYAVLPYVFQGGVEQYQWLSTTQMMDGLALGETTPGPLIMLVTYIGFVGGWSEGLLADNALLLALSAASVVTVVTFLPSFLFIFIGGPVVEASRDIQLLSGPLKAITAAVVGVIVNLALFFAYHILWPQGLAEWNIMATMDLFALAMMLLAGLLLYYFQWNMVPLLVLSALLGMAYRLLL